MKNPKESSSEEVKSKSMPWEKDFKALKDLMAAFPQPSSIMQTASRQLVVSKALHTAAYIAFHKFEFVIGNAQQEIRNLQEDEEVSTTYVGGKKVSESDWALLINESVAIKDLKNDTVNKTRMSSQLREIAEELILGHMKTLSWQRKDFEVEIEALKKLGPAGIEKERELNQALVQLDQLLEDFPSRKDKFENPPGLRWEEMNPVQHEILTRLSKYKPFTLHELDELIKLQRVRLMLEICRTEEKLTGSAPQNALNAIKHSKLDMDELSDLQAEAEEMLRRNERGEKLDNATTLYKEACELERKRIVKTILNSTKWLTTTDPYMKSITTFIIDEDESYVSTVSEGSEEILLSRLRNINEYLEEASTKKTREAFIDELKKYYSKSSHGEIVEDTDRPDIKELDNTIGSLNKEYIDFSKSHTRHAYLQTTFKDIKRTIDLPSLNTSLKKHSDQLKQNEDRFSELRDLDNEAYDVAANELFGDIERSEREAIEHNERQKLEQANPGTDIQITAKQISSLLKEPDSQVRINLQLLHRIEDQLRLLKLWKEQGHEFPKSEKAYESVNIEATKKIAAKLNETIDTSLQTSASLNDQLTDSADLINDENLVDDFNVEITNGITLLNSYKKAINEDEAYKQPFSKKTQVCLDTSSIQKSIQDLKSKIEDAIDEKRTEIVSQVERVLNICRTESEKLARLLSFNENIKDVPSYQQANSLILGIQDHIEKQGLLIDLDNRNLVDLRKKLEDWHTDILKSQVYREVIKLREFKKQVMAARPFIDSSTHTFKTSTKIENILDSQLDGLQKIEEGIKQGTFNSSLTSTALATFHGLRNRERVDDYIALLGEFTTAKIDHQGSEQSNDTLKKKLKDSTKELEELKRLIQPSPDREDRYIYIGSNFLKQGGIQAKLGRTYKSLLPTRSKVGNIAYQYKVEEGSTPVVTEPDSAQEQISLSKSIDAKPSFEDKKIWDDLERFGVTKTMPFFWLPDDVPNGIKRTCIPENSCKGFIPDGVQGEAKASFIFTDFVKDKNGKEIEVARRVPEDRLKPHHRQYLKDALKKALATQDNKKSRVLSITHIELPYYPHGTSFDQSTKKSPESKTRTFKL